MKISVVIPVHNRPDQLYQAVESVLKQTYQSFELIVVNDGSTVSQDRTQGLVLEQGHHWVDQPHRGVSAARNRGISEASQEWIAFLDSDDLWREKKLARQVEFHRNNPQVRISQCQEEWIRNGRRVNQKRIHEMPSGDAFHQSLQLCCISPSSVMLHRDLFSEHGVFDEEMKVCEDYDLWVRITPFEQVGLIEERLVVKYGGHPDQLSRSVEAMDRFRLASLLRLITSAPLSSNQRAAALEEASRRVRILYLGARKHRPEVAPMYQQLFEKLGTRGAATDIDISELMHYPFDLSADQRENCVLTAKEIVRFGWSKANRF